MKFHILSLILTYLTFTLSFARLKTNSQPLLHKSCNDQIADSLTKDTLQNLNLELYNMYKEGKTEGCNCLKGINGCASPQLIDQILNNLSSFIKKLNFNSDVEMKKDENNDDYLKMGTNHKIKFKQMITYLGDFMKDYFVCICNTKEACSTFFQSSELSMCKFSEAIPQDYEEMLSAWLDEEPESEGFITINHKSLAEIAHKFYKINKEYKRMIFFVLNDVKLDSDKEIGNYIKGCSNFGNILSDMLKNMSGRLRIYAKKRKLRRRFKALKSSKKKKYSH